MHSVSCSFRPPSISPSFQRCSDLILLLYRSPERYVKASSWLRYYLNSVSCSSCSSSEGEMTSKASGPLIDVTSGGRYSGQKLKLLIGALQSKTESNVIADEFKVRWYGFLPNLCIICDRNQGQNFLQLNFMLFIFIIIVIIILLSSFPPQLLSIRYIRTNIPATDPSLAHFCFK